MPDSPIPTAAPALLRLAAWLPALAFLLTVLAPPLNHDVAALLDFTGRWWAGERLYADLIDVNPPLIFLLTLAPVAISAWTPLGPVAAMLACLLAVCALATGMALRLAPRGGMEGACLAVALPMLAVAAGYDFGQREHLMAVAALPYLLVAARRAEGEPAGAGMRLASTLLAALGFALKPHFLAIPALVEAVVLLRRGPARALRDPVPWGMAALWLLYLASIPAFFPNYLHHVLPLVRDYYLGLGDFAWWQVILSERLGTALAALLPLALVAARGGFGALPQVVAAAGLGAALAAIVQQKGWTYHAVPVRMMAGLLAVLLAARWLDRALPARRALAAAPGAAVAAAFILFLHNLAGAEAPWREITWRWSRAGELAALVGREAPGGRVLVLSPDIFPVYPALNYAGAHSTLRTMNLWLLQGVYGACPEGGARYHEIGAMPPAEALLFRRTVEDVSAAPPDAILVARHAGIPACGKEFDVLEYLSRDPAFAAVLRRYRPAGGVEGYRLLRRAG
ncbi:hypothetical protein [Belnapia rosea]|uniref:4-amino-4-deoxy-L-arabinose transferase n=1 Tax=Belnapia rosea TaxID=938405 RepID=A0A1G6JTS2_9PROT|nr:hypothetical protein [Belnapia rosea]SDC22150.1 hypothetical protein SAMN04487779_1001276 [Belnapia rosea]